MSASFSSTPRTALVTGAGKRLGREIALGLARAGWRVAVHYRSSEAEALQTAADCLQAFAQWQAQAGFKAEGGDASVSHNGTQVQRQDFIFKADLAKEEDARKLLPQVVSQLGRVDAVINSAALFEHDDVQSFSYANMAQHWASNTGAAIVLAQALHQHCQSRSNFIKCCPPSTNKVVPVMARLCTANTTALTTSSTDEDRPKGLRV